MSGTRLLIVDDDSRFRNRLGSAFADRGFEVALAEGAEEALKLAPEFRPERAIVDLRMDGPSGLELLEQLVARFPGIRVVMLTGFGSIATAVEAMRLGATNYVSKPADVEDILAAFAEERGASQTSGEFQPPSLARMEWEYINRVLLESGGNISEAARRLGMHRRTLQRKLGKYPPKDAGDHSSSDASTS